MRKLFLLLMLLLSLCLCMSAQADTFTFDDFSATCQIDGKDYTILTPANLAAYTDWLAARGLTQDAVLADWSARGVLLQAWSDAGDACLEISAVQDEFASQYYDVNQVSADDRKVFRLGHSSDKDGFYRSQGYDYTEAEWKNTKNAGRFLMLKYTRTVGSETWRGYSRKTIRNGYTIHLDYQVYGRGLKNTDKTALDAVMNSWEFLEIFPRPATSVSKLVFSQRPPVETNSSKFTVKGTGTAGLRVIGVIMRLNTNDVKQFETTIGKNGKFDISVTLPREGVWLMTYTVENGSTVVEEGVFDAITYQKDLLPVTLNSELPTVLTGSELVVSGKTLPKTMVQCIVDGRYQKTITTNNSGEFSFTLDTSEEGEYAITLVFEKKGSSSRRFRTVATRTFTEGDRMQMIRDEAVKPAYNTLVDKLSGYKGRYMVYTLYIQSVEETPTGYLAFAGMSKNKSGEYKNMVALRSTENPGYAAGDKITAYLKCIGSYEVQLDAGTEHYPYFDLQWLE